MKYLILLVLVLSGCGECDDYIISCDSGFSTGTQPYAVIDDGVIRWRDNGNQWTSRKMINGEVCQRNRPSKVR